MNNHPPFVKRVHERVNAILLEALRWNALGFRGMPVYDLTCNVKCNTYSIEEQNVRDALEAHGFKLGNRLFRGKPTVVISWDQIIE